MVGLRLAARSSPYRFDVLVLRLLTSLDSHLQRIAYRRRKLGPKSRINTSSDTMASQGGIPPSVVSIPHPQAYLMGLELGERQSR